jgi:hypothetical protein
VRSTTATLLGLGTVGLTVLSFLVLGFGRLLFGYRTAVVLAAPFGLTAFLLAVALFVGFTLARLGVGPLADVD